MLLCRQENRGAATVVYRNKNGLFLGASAVVFEGLVDPASLEAHEPLALASDLIILMSTGCMLHQTA